FLESGNHSDWWQKAGMKLAPASFFYQNELNIARLNQEFLLPLVDAQNRTVSPEQVRRNNQAITNELNHFSPYKILAKMAFPAVNKLVIKYAREQSVVDLARVAFALERYRLAHGDYPESLEALSPHFMGKTPNDIVGGKPLIYRRTSDSQFILYSIGWNERDDGGVTGHYKESTVPDYTKGDLVWRYPQK
ncbi:MAG TPA: hypothetical protein VN516_07105, partial [Candidatus Baltobacteraceae bacterium]|nr:hypothetical protein [Candidatus Baltobacteraceae bacterium]